MNNTIFELKNISKEYRTKVETIEILKNINFKLNQGQSKPVQTKQTQAKPTNAAKKRRPTTQPTFVQKDKSEKVRTPFVKIEDIHVSHETKATKRPAFVVRTRQK